MTTFPLVAAGAMMPGILSGSVGIERKWPLFIQFMESVIAPSGLWVAILSWLAISAGAVVVNEYFNRHDFLNEATHIPGFLFALFGGFMAVQAPLASVGILFFLLALGRITKLQKQPGVVHLGFEAGFLTAVGALFIPEMLVVVPFYTITTVANRSANLREVIMPFIGVGLAAWLWFSILFVFLPAIDFKQYLSELSGQPFSRPSAAAWVAIVAVVIGLPGFLGSLNGSTIKSRGEKTAFLFPSLGLLLALLIGWFWLSEVNEMIVLPGIAVLGGYFFRTTRARGEVREAVFYLLLAAVLAAEFFSR
jgi:hypothetical protein